MHSGGNCILNLSSSVFVAPNHELEEERKPGESEPPRIRCPLCDWSPRKSLLNVSVLAMSFR
jgi:hypothetical protein